jgi:hypothetical protein
MWLNIRYFIMLICDNIRRNVVHSNHIFVTTMQLVSKPIYFMTNNVLVLCVHVVATCCSRICNYRKG